VVKAVNKCDFKLVVNETPTKWRPVEKKKGDTVTAIHVLTASICFPPTAVASVETLTKLFKVKRILLSKGH
jgi:hypothetical protein